ncbi:MAG: aldose 1-epimerase family protein [bacterium]|nr:aldose 1-epimerase family protein [bacterium]
MMPKLFGKAYSKRELLRRIGNLSQIGGTRLYELSDGPEKGVRAVDFRTGTGFAFTALPDRGLDISAASYRGMSLVWRSPVGEVSPSFYEPEGLGWLRTFHGGLLTTCGLTHVGAPGRDGGESFGLHGRYSTIPARDVCVDANWRDDEYTMWVKGVVRQAVLFGENLTLTRKVSAKLGESCLTVEDLVENSGFNKCPFLILYHINAGFPLVDAGTQLVTTSASVTARDEEAEKGKEEHNVMSEPVAGYREKCYFFEMKTDSEGYAYSALLNEELELGLYVKYRKDTLPHFVEWKMMGEGAYVVGMEPANNLLRGRAAEREAGTLVELEPGQRVSTFLEIGVLSSRNEIKEFKKSVTGILKAS